MDSDVQTYESCHSDGGRYVGRIDVVTGPTGRRRWPEHVKASIVLETYRDGVSVADIARKHDISPPQLHAWRRAARKGVLPMPGEDEMAFLPVSVSSGDAADPDHRGGTLTLEIGEVRLRVPAAFDADHLARVVTALRRAS